MTKEDSGLQVSASHQPITRGRVGLVVDGTYAAVATKTIAAADYL